MKHAMIIFAKDANLTKVREQLKTLKHFKAYKFHCLFLPRQLVEKEGFSTEIVDMLEEELGNDLIWELEGVSTLDAAKNIIKIERERLGKEMDNVFYLGCELNSGIIDEIEASSKILILK